MNHFDTIARPVRVRFAPSPTGPLHIGGVRTALYNYLFAKKHEGTFILRIEDTDQGRYVPGAEGYIIESLKWVGLQPTEGVGFGDGAHAPYRQSERKPMYRQYAMALLENGKAYYAFDTSEELETLRDASPDFKYGYLNRNSLNNSLNRSPEEVQSRLDNGDDYVIRLKVPENETVTFHDLIRGEVSFHSSEIDDKVLLKGDGMPTYHLANIVDDHLMEVSHVIRGEEWLPSTGHHVLLYRSFGWEETMPQFAHLPLILKPDGKGKLSKRDGAKFGMPVFPLGWQSPEESFDGFREFGFLPEAVVNFLAFVGWNPGTEQEIFTEAQLVEAFSVEKISKSGARFDYDKAKWFNQQYIQAASGEDLAAHVAHLAAAKGYHLPDAQLAALCDLLKERAVLLPDFLSAGKFAFEPVQVFDNENIAKRWKPESRPVFEALFEKIAAAEPFEADVLELLIKEFITERALKMGEVMPLLRIALSGSMQGPAVHGMMAVLGREATLERLRGAIAHFEMSR